VVVVVVIVVVVVVVVVVLVVVAVVEIVEVVIIVSQRTPSMSCWQVQLKPSRRAWLRWQSTAMHREAAT
jgi:predicted PurR-regulated permease PerM